MPWLAALLLAVLPFGARAADDDLPGRVGRIAEFAGQLFQSPQDRPTEWDAIGINYPITSGDNLWVSGDGRAEVDYGGGQFRLAGDTSVHVSRLDDRQLALFVAQGRLIVRVRALDPGDVTRIDTPNTQVTLTRPGLYRVDVVPDQEATTLTVREGEAIVALANGAQQTLPGQTVSVVGADPAAADIRNSFGVDGFDTWSADRDRRYEGGRSTAYVSREMVGYADLDEHGTWQTYPDYGAVWFPTAVATDWAPYRDGYWTDVGGWGPTWVDRAPWGYAPSHYGRWARIGGRWGWAPGGYVARPVWAPALVAWVGGPGWGFSVGRGAPVYGWVPLGWGDAYHPSWRRCSYNCWARYNRPYARQRHRASDVAAGAVCERGRARRALGGCRAGAGRATAGGHEPGEPADLAREVGAGDDERAAGGEGTSACPGRRRREPESSAGRIDARPGAATGTGRSGAFSRPPVAVAGPGAAPTARSGGAGQGGTWSVPMPAARPGPSSAPAHAPPVSSPEVSGAFAPTPPAQRESGGSQAPRQRDPAVPSMAPQAAPRTTPVPSRNADTTSQTRREPSRPREIAVPPAASPAVPAGAGLSTPNAPRPVPSLPAPAPRAARPASPGLPAGARRARRRGGATAWRGPPRQRAVHAGPRLRPKACKGRTSVEKSVPDAPPAATGRVR